MRLLEKGPKRAFLTAVAALVGLQSLVSVAATPVSGTIATNTTWTTGGSPYQATGTVSVASNTVLTVEAGVRIELGPGANLQVMGTLNAAGTAGSPVIFTNMTGATAGGLRFTGAGVSSLCTGILSHCEVWNLQGDPVLNTSYADLRIDGSTFRDLPNKVINPHDSRLRIVGNTISNVAEAINAVRCTGLIASNRIMKINGYADAIDLDYAWTGGGDTTMRLLRNEISDASDPDADGIDFGTSPGIAEGNIIRNFGDKGISVGERSPALVYNNLIIGCNIGVAIKDSSAPDMLNNTIVNCVYGIRSYQKNAGAGGGKGTLTNSVIWGCSESISLLNGSTLQIDHCVIQGTNVWDGSGNSNANPEFADPAGDFRLLPGSPCINAGTNVALLVGEFDVEGHDRIAEGTVDIGAYEYTTGALLCNLIPTPAKGPAPLSVDFTAHVDGTNTTGLYFWWTLPGSDQPLQEGAGLDQVSAAYTNVGHYTVSLAVSNAAGEIASVTRSNCVTAVGPPIAYVSSAGGHVFPYATWEEAATNIQAAVDVGLDGSLVLVTDGVYTVTAPILIDEQVVVRSVNGAEATVIDGGATSRCVTLAHPDAILEGFTVRNGSATNGGGIFFNAGGTARHCIVTGNVAEAEGAGVYYHLGGTLQQSRLVNNTTPADGGGAYCYRGGTLDRCWIQGNRSTANDGGGVFFFNNGGVVQNCVLTGNRAASAGGGIYLSSGGVVQNATIVSNTAATGGGTRASGGGKIEGSIAYFNTATTGPNYSDTVTTVWSFSCSTPLPTGTGNISTNPAFRDLAMLDLRLSPGSPCINAAASNAWMTGATDFDENSRVIGALPDMGAYEAGFLVCDFTASPSSGFAPLPVTFQASVSGTNLSALSYAWDFEGDGTNELSGAEWAAAAHSYSTYGAFTVSLTVSNDAGETASAIRTHCVIVTPETLYVAREAQSAYPYATWETAATNIQTALDAAGAGAQVLVSNGTYRLAAPLSIVRGIALRAAGDGVVLDAQGSNRCLSVSHTNAVVEGFTITRGSAVNGGGVYLAGGTVQNCTIVSNASTTSGGGIYVSGSGLVQRCRIMANTAGAAYGLDAGGAGVCLWLGGTIRNSLLTGNFATTNDAGGLYLYTGGLAENCVIVSNRAADAGGGVYMINGGAIENSTIADNIGARGGGIRAKDGGTTRNCIIWGNTATNAVDIATSNRYDTSTSHTFCDSAPLPAGAGNLAAPPLFANPLLLDFRLLAGSPCIDKGTNAPSTPTADYDGIPRPLDGNLDGTNTADIGAYEFVNAAADSDGDSMPDGWEQTYFGSTNPLAGNPADDPDHDGVVNGDEFIAGTDPTNGLDVFSLDAEARGGSTLVSFQTRAAAGAAYAGRTRTYHLYGCTNLVAGDWFPQEGATNLPATDTRVTVTNQAPPPIFLQGRVRLDP